MTDPRRCPICGRTREARFFSNGKPGVARVPTGWALACRICQRRHSRVVADVKRRYGSILVQQHGLCKACGLPPGHGRALEIDVDHQFWLFRGLVHRVCNNICGMVGDNPDVLRSLAHYLEHAWDDRVVQPRLAP